MRNIPILYFSHNMRITNKRVGGGDYWWEINQFIINRIKKRKTLGDTKTIPTIPKGKTISGFHNIE